MNKVILTGRLVKDPEYKKNGDIATCTFFLAVDRDFKNKESGEREADFLKVIIWNGFAENLYPMLRKGKKILVEGQIRTGSYEKEGETKYTINIYGTKIEFLEKKEREIEIEISNGYKKEDDEEIEEQRKIEPSL